MYITQVMYKQRSERMSGAKSAGLIGVFIFYF